MKTLFEMCVVGLLCCGLVACGDNANEVNPNQSDVAPDSAEPTAEQATIIEPSYEQTELDIQLVDFYEQWKAVYLRQGCGNGRYYVDAAGDGKNVEGGTADSTLSISEGYGYGMLVATIAILTVTSTSRMHCC